MQSYTIAIGPIFTKLQWVSTPIGAEYTRRLRERYNLYLPVTFRIDVPDLDQAAGQPRPARRHHRGLRRRLDHQTTARARAAHRGPDRNANGPEDPDVKLVQARLLVAGGGGTMPGT